MQEVETSEVTKKIKNKKPTGPRGAAVDGGRVTARLVQAN